MCFKGKDIEFNPDPDNGYMLLQSRLAECGLSLLDVGGAGDCFFRAVSHQLHGEPSYHKNIRSVGVQYMRANPDRFIESIVGDSWARYLATVPLKGKLTVPRSSILETRFSILESRKLRGSRLESSFETFEAV